MVERIIDVVEKLGALGGVLFTGYKCWIAWLKKKDLIERLKKCDEEAKRLRDIIERLER